jgi:hypothetical protein
VHAAQKELCKLAFLYRWSSAIVRLVGTNCLDHGLILVIVGMAEDVCGKGGVVIDVLVAVHIPQA